MYGHEETRMNLATNITAVALRRLGRHLARVMADATLSVLAIVFIVGPQNVALAMPGSDHLYGIDDLGGAIDLVGSGPDAADRLEKARSVFDWMDNPAQKTGQYRLGVNRQWVNPNNHNFIRHNPQRVARALSGSGQVTSEVLDLARLHKIQDMAHNVRPVDGWPLTPRMKKDAEITLRYLSRYKKLPSRLPAWVDKSGPLITSTKNVRAVPFAKPTRVRIPPGIVKAGGQVVRIGGKVLPVVAVTVVGGMGVVEFDRINCALTRGEITEEEAILAHGRNLGGTIAGLTVLGAGMALATIAAPTGPVAILIIAASIGASIAAEKAGSILGEWIAIPVAQAIAEQNRRRTEVVSGYFQAKGDFTVTPQQMAEVGFHRSEVEAYLKAWNSAPEALRRGVAVTNTPPPLLMIDDFTALEMLDGEVQAIAGGIE